MLVAAFVLLSLASGAQNYNISSIITDYNGYWKSGVGAINNVKPDNSHNLLAFTYNNVRYSTGVNDAKLIARGDLFVPGDYRALPVVSLTAAANSNSKIGLGEMYDGVTNGKSNPSPVNNIPYYLTDGEKGLDLGTCVANLPKSAINFSVNNVKLTAINDGVPDVVITQAADPSGTDFDTYEFTDVNGNRIGNSVDIVLNNIPSVGNWVADFYEASQNPMGLAGGFTKTERPLRLWTADFGVFGINASNISSIAYFKISLNGNSDVAFVAYNNSAFNVGLILPTKLTSFTATSANNAIDLNWQTASENNTSKFIVERSYDGSSFMPIGTVKAAGVSNIRRNYSFTAPAYNGRSYYRLKMTDLDGQSTFSTVVSVNSGASTDISVNIYPNPATSYAIVKHPFVSGSETIRIVNAQGVTVSQVKATVGQTKLDLSKVARGVYHVVYSSAAGNQALAFVAQ